MATGNGEVDMAARALLPAGLRDALPPEAAHEAGVVERLMALLGSHGYERVKPPLVEFETSLLAGPGEAMTHRTFRLMDPVSQRMMGVRADMTVQVARIATTRLASAPRPLRLSYAGEVLLVAGTPLAPERELVQVGAELIGTRSPEEGAAADAEIVLLAVEALATVGVVEVSVDLTLPTLVPAVCAAYGLAGPGLERLRAALDHKDGAAVAARAGEAGPLLARLMAATGDKRECLEALAAMALPPDAAAGVARLAEVVGLIERAAPGLAVTIDPVENRGLEYHTGVSFSIFARGVRGELGRGGRYRAGSGVAGGGEDATGVTLYMESVLRALPAAEAEERLYLPAGTPVEIGRRLRAEGWATVAGLAPVADPSAEARRLGCARVWRDGAAAPSGEGTT